MPPPNGRGERRRRGRGEGARLCPQLRDLPLQQIAKPRAVPDALQVGCGGGVLGILQLSPAPLHDDGAYERARPVLWMRSGGNSSPPPAQSRQTLASSGERSLTSLPRLSPAARRRKTVPRFLPPVAVRFLVISAPNVSAALSAVRPSRVATLVDRSAGTVQRYRVQNAVIRTSTA